MPSVQSKGQRITCPKCSWSHVPSTGPLHTGVYKSQCRRCGHNFTFKSTTLPRQSVTFTVNGTEYSVSEEDSDMVLTNFLSERAGLRKTKYTCYSGGCGSCVVTATYHDQVLDKERTVSFNSCLRPVYACDGWAITTTEGLGNGRKGYHPIQESLAEKNGSQCGWCSPGMVMSMYSYVQNNPEMSLEEIEGQFDGNICRCTGYRAILDAMKSLATPGQCALDIEDMGKLKICRSSGQPCTGQCNGSVNQDPVHVILKDTDWHAPTTLQQLYDILNSSAGKSVKLIMGNTTSGVYSDSYDISVDIKAVADLYQSVVTANDLVIGASVTLSNMRTLLTEASANTGFEYCTGIVDHMGKLANTPVRNVGTWAGNLVMKKMHPEFPSDIFVILETVGGLIRIGNAADGSISTVTPGDLLNLDLSGKVILSVTFPKINSSEFINTYKVMPRSQSAFGYTVVGFFLDFDVGNNHTVQGSPRIAFGGISSSQYRAPKTEQYLVGKAVGSNEGLQGALKELEAEITAVVAETGPTLTDETFRKDMVTAMFYRYMLGVVGDEGAARYRSGGYDIQRPVSQTSQDFSTLPGKYPITEPMPKIAAKKQVANEAEYILGIPNPPGTLFGQFVLATKGNCKIASIDPSRALAFPGVVKFLSADDIPGTNNFYPIFTETPEELFCSGHVEYAGQAVGLIIAESQGAAIAASNMVTVDYTDEEPPIITIEDAVAAESFFPSPPDLKVGDAETAIENSPHKIEGDFYMPDQYHLHMENQTAFCVPSETGLEVHASTQWPDMTQQAVATVTGMNNNNVRVQVRRCGGGYGAKISRNFPVSAGAGLAAYLMERPVRVALTLGANMRMLGKRFPYKAHYTAGVDDDGKLNGVKIHYYCDAGSQANEAPLFGVFVWADNAYKCANWHLSGKICKTNKPANTWCRSPGSVPAICITEVMMEHIAKQLNKDPLEVKKLNFFQQNDISITGTPLPYCNISEMTAELEDKASISTRKTAVAQFNQNNRWKKRGLATVPLKFGIGWKGFPFNVLVSIFNGDGSVTIEHGGVEIGQGIHTKVIQVCAAKLGIPLSMVNVVPTTTVVTANSESTGGSITSELCMYGVEKCCDTLLDRLRGVAGDTWGQRIKNALTAGIDLTARYWSNPGQQQTYAYQYFCYGVGCAEVELDVLTGSRQVNRVDILYDCGESVNPEIDIGQIEGAFIMGLGYYFTEHSIYDKDSGQYLTGSILDYHVPVAKDIPVDFRVDLLKNSFNPLGIIGNKAVAEPPQCLSCAVLIALRHAVEEARAEAHSTDHFRFDAPATVDVTQPFCLNDISQYELN